MTTATETQSANLEATDQPEKIVYAITEVCGRLLISPDGKPHLPPRLMDALLRAMAGVGDIDEAIQAAEDHWQITDWDRIQALEIAGLDACQVKARVGMRLIASRERFRRGTHFRDEVISAPAPGAMLRDPEIVAFIQAEAIKVADLEREIAELEANAGRKALRRAKLLKVEVRAARRRMENARDIEVRRDARMGEARDPLIRAKHRGELAAVQEVETAEIARDEYGARIVNRRGLGRGLPALAYSRHTRVRVLGGIQHAHAQGYLDNPRSGRGGDALLQVGEQYERAVADANPLKAVDPEASGGGGPRGPQVRAIQASEWLKIARLGLSARELRVLDLICGEGHHAARAARLAGFGFQATLRALRGGLATAAANHLAAIANGHQPVARQLLLGELLTR